MLFDSKWAADPSNLLDSGLFSRRTVSMVAVTGMALLLGAGQGHAQTGLQLSATNPNELTLATATTPMCVALSAFSMSHSLTSDESDLLDRCTAAIVAAGSTGSSEATDILSNIASEEINAQHAAIDGTVAPQTRAVAGRLSGFKTGGGIGFAQAGPDNPASGPQYASYSDWQFAASEDGVSGTSLSGLGFFLNGSYNFGDKDETSLESGFDFDDYSVTGGVDYFFTDNFVAGVAFGYGYTDVDFDGGAGDISTYGYTGSLYAFFNPLDQLGLTGLMSFTSLEYDSNRNISYTETATSTVISRTASGDADADNIELSATAYYDFTYDALTFGPTGRLSYNALDIDGFTEGGAGGLNITYPDQHLESLVTAVGGAASYALSTDFGVAVFQARGEWEHEYLDDGQSITLFYANDVTMSAATGFSLISDDPDRNRFNVGGGVSVLFAGGISAFADFETVLGHDDVSSYTITSGVRYQFN